MDSDDDTRMYTDSENDSEVDDPVAVNQHNQNLIIGKIYEVYLKNFLTHTELTVHPSEQLNLVSFFFFMFYCFVWMNMLILFCSVSTFAPSLSY